MRDCIWQQQTTAWRFEHRHRAWGLARLARRPSGAGTLHVSAIATTLPPPQAFVQAFATGGPSQPDVLQVALLEGCAGSVRLSGQRQLGCYHQWTMDAAVAQRGAEAAAFAAVGLSDNSVRVYALQRGKLQVRGSFGGAMYLACQLLAVQ